MLNHLTVREVIDLIDDLLAKRDSFETPRQGQPFTAVKRGDLIEVQNSKGNVRPIRDQDLVRVIRRLHALDHPSVAQFQDVSHNASYILALVLAATKDERLTAVLAA